MSGSRPPNSDPVIFRQTQGHFFCKFCTPHGVEDKNLMDVFKAMDHGTQVHRIENLGDLGEFVSVCGFVHDWKIAQRKAAKLTSSESQDKKNQFKKDDDDEDFKYGPSEFGAPSYSATLKQNSSTAAPSTYAAGAPSNPNPSPIGANMMNQIPMNFPYVTCDRCRERNRECHLDVFGQHCADCYCIGRKCFVNGVHTREIWRGYATQNPGAKAGWVTPNYRTDIPDRQKRKKVAAGKKGVVDVAKRPQAE